MKTWAAVSEALLIGVVSLHAAALLWPRRAGYYYLRYGLSRRGIQIKGIPPECIRDFVDDALDYARTVSAPASRPAETLRTLVYFEFERMLRNHSCVVHALLTGRTVAEVDSVGELIRCEMLRAGVNPCGNSADCQRIENEVRTGKSWDRHRAILCRYDLPTPVSRVAIG